MIKEALKNFKNKKCLILSTENDKNIMLAPLLKEMVCLSMFEILTDKAVKVFPQAKSNTTSMEKINMFLNRIRVCLKVRPHIICLLLDPLPRFLDWNNETLATLMIDGLRDICKEFGICVIGVRNEGKNKQYESEALYKGTSAIGDNSRQVNRALKVHRMSDISKKLSSEKEKKKKKKTPKGLVIYTELSSLYAEEAYLFKLDIVKTKKEGIPVAVPVFIEKLTCSMDTLKYLCSRESGKTLANRIFTYIQKTPQKGCTLEDLYNEFGEINSFKVIRNTVYKHFDHKTLSGVTYIQLKETKKG